MSIMPDLPFASCMKGMIECPCRWLWSPGLPSGPPLRTCFTPTPTPTRFYPLRRPGTSSASSAPGLVIPGGYARGIHCPLRVPPPPEASHDVGGDAILFISSNVFPDGGWPRFPPDVTARNDEGLPANVRSGNPRPSPLRAPIRADPRGAVEIAIGIAIEIGIVL